MNLPIPPTDNLYKFAALSGTILFILGLYTPLYLDEQFNDKSVNLELKNAKLTADIDYCNRQLKLSAADSSNSEKLKAGLRETSELLRQEDQQIQEQKILIKNIERLGKQIIIADLISIFIILLGLAVVIIGYRLWYIRIQRPMDKSMTI